MVTYVFLNFFKSERATAASFETLVRKTMRISKLRITFRDLLTGVLALIAIIQLFQTWSADSLHKKTYLSEVRNTAEDFLGRYDADTYNRAKINKFLHERPRAHAYTNEFFLLPSAPPTASEYMPLVLPVSHVDLAPDTSSIFLSPSPSKVHSDEKSHLGSVPSFDRRLEFI